MGTAFLELANKGKTRWWVYLISSFVIMGIWLLGSGISIGIVFGEDLLKGQGIKPFDGSRPFAELTALGLTFVALVAGIWVGIRGIHRRSLLSLITPGKGIRWQRILQGFKWHIAFFILFTGIEELIFPGTYTFTLNPDVFYKFVLLVILFIPLQAASEELLFRGYILQALGHWIRQPGVLMVLNGLGFMSLHFANPEIEHGLPVWLSYFAWGAVLTFFTLKDNTAELAIGIHIANNVFAAIFVNYEGSALPTNAVFTASEIHPWFALITYLISAIFLYYMLFRNHQPVEREPTIETENLENKKLSTAQ